MYVVNRRASRPPSPRARASSARLVAGALPLLETNLNPQPCGRSSASSAHLAAPGHLFGGEDLEDYRAPESAPAYPVACCTPYMYMLHG